jgi:hypothetical protein
MKMCCCRSIQQPIPRRWRGQPQLHCVRRKSGWPFWPRTALLWKGVLTGAEWVLISRTRYAQMSLVCCRNCEPATEKYNISCYWLVSSIHGQFAAGGTDMMLCITLLYLHVGHDSKLATLQIVVLQMAWELPIWVWCSENKSCLILFYQIDQQKLSQIVLRVLSGIDW